MSAPALVIAATATMAAGQMAATSASRQVSRMNAGLAEQQADAQAQAGILEQRELYRRQVALEGRQVALYGVSGVRGDVGSPADVIERTARNASLDRLAAAYNNRVQVLQSEHAAEAERWQSRVAGRAGMIQVAGTLLGGAQAYRQVGGTLPRLTAPSWTRIV